MDSVLGRLFEEIAALPHGELLHVILVSDHGMTLSNRGTILLDDHANLDGVMVVAATTIASLYFDGDTLRREDVARRFARVPGLRVFTREAIPAEWHIKANPRAGDLLLVADEGWLLRRRNSRPESGVATHGWPPSRSMQGIFIAAGPRIRAGMRIPPFENIHIYPFMAALLGLRGDAEIDGRVAVLAALLK
jgi:alkaline phosphatase D